MNKTNLILQSALPYDTGYQGLTLKPYLSLPCIFFGVSKNCIMLLHDPRIKPLHFERGIPT